MIRYFGQLKYYNFFRRIFVFFKFFVDNIQNYEFYLILVSWRYLLLGKSHNKNLVVTTNIGKFELRAESLDFVTANSAYEFGVMNVLKHEIIDCDIFLDIGANIGTYSVFAGKSCIRTLAFEPIKSNFDSLVKNIELNNLQSYIDTFNVGLSNATEKSNFNFNKLNTGASSLYNLRSNANGVKCEVKLVVGDDLNDKYLAEAKHPIIKIDVEGMEIAVLDGLKILIQEKESLKIIIETKHSGEEKIKQKLLDFGDFHFMNIDAYNLLAIKIKKWIH